LNSRHFMLTAVDTIMLSIRSVPIIPQTAKIGMVSP
jgi:hypothetical protein